MEWEFLLIAHFPDHCIFVPVYCMGKFSKCVESSQFDVLFMIDGGDFKVSFPVHYENMPMQIYREFLSFKNCKFLAGKF